MVRMYVRGKLGGVLNRKMDKKIKQMIPKMRGRVVVSELSIDAHQESGFHVPQKNKHEEILTCCNQLIAQGLDGRYSYRKINKELKRNYNSEYDEGTMEFAFIE